MWNCVCWSKGWRCVSGELSHSIHSCTLALFHVYIFPFICQELVVKCGQKNREVKYSVMSWGYISKIYCVSVWGKEKPLKTTLLVFSLGWLLNLTVFLVSIEMCNTKYRKRLTLKSWLWTPHQFADLFNPFLFIYLII